MGKYFNPPTRAAAIGAGGRQLNGTRYPELMKQLAPGECLVGRFDRGLFYLMPLLLTKNEYDEFMHQYNGGYLLSYEFYAMPNSVFGICDVSAASTISGASASTTSGASASTTSGASASTTSGASASTTSGTAASTTSGTAASNIGDIETHYEKIVRINALMAEKAGMVATCRNCKSNGRSGQKCPKCGGYCF